MILDPVKWTITVNFHTIQIWLAEGTSSAASQLLYLHVWAATCSACLILGGSITRVFHVLPSQGPFILQAGPLTNLPLQSTCHLYALAFSHFTQARPTAPANKGNLRKEPSSLLRMAACCTFISISKALAVSLFYISLLGPAAKIYILPALPFFFLALIKSSYLLD